MHAAQGLASHCHFGLLCALLAHLTFVTADSLLMSTPLTIRAPLPTPHRAPPFLGPAVLRGAGGAWGDPLAGARVARARLTPAEPCPPAVGLGSASASCCLARSCRPRAAVSDIGCGGGSCGGGGACGRPCSTWRPLCSIGSALPPPGCERLVVGAPSPPSLPGFSIVDAAWATRISAISCCQASCTLLGSSMPALLTWQLSQQAPAWGQIMAGQRRPCGLQQTQPNAPSTPAVTTVEPSARGVLLQR
jgi:hypothetical protein